MDQPSSDLGQNPLSGPPLGSPTVVDPAPPSKPIIFSSKGPKFHLPNFNFKPSKTGAALMGAFSLIFFGGLLVVGLRLSQQSQEVKKPQAAGDLNCFVKWASNCDGSLSPANGSAISNLKPHFHWVYGGYDGSACSPSLNNPPYDCAGYGARVVLFEGTNQIGASAADITTNYATLFNLEVGNLQMSDWARANGYTPNSNEPNYLNELKPNTSYSWTVVSRFRPKAGCSDCSDNVHPGGPTWTFQTPSAQTTPLVCNSIASSPTSTTITAGGQTRNLTATVSGPTGTSVSWAATGGSLSATSGQNVTWTAPATLPAATTSWTVTASANANGQSVTTDACKITYTYTYVPPLVSCDSLTVSPTGQTITQNSQVKTLTPVVTGGTAPFVFTWDLTTTGTDKGTITNSATNATWTAPANLTSQTTAQSWTIKATVTDANGKTDSSKCVTSFNYLAPLVCVSVTINPDNATVAATGETRNLTAKVSGGSGNVSVDWNVTSSGSKGIIEKNNTSGLSATWTGPTLSSESQTWHIVATAKDTSGATNTNDNCRIDLSYTAVVPPKYCSSACSTDSQCPTSLKCLSGVCRNPSCSDRADCVCLPAQCNSSCTDSSTCPSGMGCVGGQCRNPQCPTFDTCVCPPPATVYYHFTCVNFGCAKTLCSPSTTPCADTCTSDVSCQPAAKPPAIPVSGVELPTILTMLGGAALLLIGILF